MERQHHLETAVRRLLRAAALVAVVAGFLALAGLDAGPARAQPVLAFEGSCSPDPVRPGEAVLMTCTTRITNSGDAPATGLLANFDSSETCGFADVTALGYRNNGGDLFPLPPGTRSFPMGDLAPDATVESDLVMLVRNFGSGLTGGAMLVFSLDDTSIRAEGDLCWTVAAGASAPPTNLRVTKRFVRETGGEIPAPGPGTAGFDLGEPPPRPPDGLPVPIVTPPTPTTVQYEIVVTNVGTADMAGVSVLDIETGAGVILTEAEPPPTSRDRFSRPSWDLGTIAAGAESRILATYGTQNPVLCAFAYDIVIVTAAPAGGGEQESYVAEVDRPTQIGACEGGETSLCWHYPPEGSSSRPNVAPCALEVCWLVPLEGAEHLPFWGPEDCGQEWCWYLPPDGGQPQFSSCTNELCWVSFNVFEGRGVEPGGGGELSPISCSVEYCEFTSPDGAQTIRDYCGEQLCWSAPPGGGAYRPWYGCDQRGDACWFSPADGSRFVLSSCEFDFCFIAPPPGALVLFDGAVAFPCEELPPGTELCWPVSPFEGEFYAFPSECGRQHCWAAPPDGGPEFEVDCNQAFCWVPAGEFLPPEFGIPPDLLLPVSFACEDPTEMGQPGGSEAAATAVAGISSPATLIESTSARIPFQRSASIVRATIVRPEFRPGPPPPVSPPDDGPEPPTPPEPPRPPGRPTGTPHTLSDLLGLVRQQPAATGLPSAGAGPPDGGGALWPWALAAGIAGLALAGASTRLARRR